MVTGPGWRLEQVLLHVEMQTLHAARTDGENFGSEDALCFVQSFSSNSHLFPANPLFDFLSSICFVAYRTPMPDAINQGFSFVR